MLRWYQEQAVKAVWAYLQTKKGAPCVVLPTGSGKTHVIAELCRQVVAWGGRALVLAHVQELLTQSYGTIKAVFDAEFGAESGKTVGLYSAGLGERSTAASVVVAGIQSVYQRAEELGEFQLIVIDEAHLIPPDGTGRYRTLLEAERVVSPKARLVGLTATPYRMGCGWIVSDRAGDEPDTGYDRLLDTIVYDVPVSDLIADGTLSSVVSKQARKAPDYSGVHIKRGDYDEAEVEQVLLRKNVLETACLEIVEQTSARDKVLIFCNRRASARRVAALLEQYDPTHLSAVIDGDTSAADRAELVKAFKADASGSNLLGEPNKPLKYICNVGVLTTGFDAPNVTCVVLLRPTKSLALYQQIVGRGLRRSPAKTDCLVLDYGGNVDRHGPIDIPKPTKATDAGATMRQWKTCASCGAVVALYHTNCPLCGQAFPRGRSSDPTAGLSGTASTGSVVSMPLEAEVLVVDKVVYEPYYKRGADPDAPPTLKVTYWLKSSIKPVCEWVCPGHSSKWARQRFWAWWKERSKAVPPSDAETAAEWATAGALATPTKIRVSVPVGSRFAEVTWVEAGEAPDFDAAAYEDAKEERANDFAAFEEAEPQKTCKQCRHWAQDDIMQGKGFCSRYGVEEPPKGAGPGVCYEEPWPVEELPF